MRAFKSNITQKLISPEDTQDLLLTFFPDSFILKHDLSIVAVGKQTAKTLGFKTKELLDKPIESLSYKASLNNIIEKELINGYFNRIDVLLKGKENIIDCAISGFYLGLISELNGLIILKVKFRNHVVHLHNQLEKSRNELDEFVYRTAHDLRGPLATMKGLVNLMKLEPVNQEMVKLIDMMESQSQKMDDRLFNLQYLSEFAFSGTSDNKLDCEALESKLRSTIEENIPINCVDFHFITSRRFFKKVNAQLVTAMINHLVLYLANLPNNEKAELVIRLSDSKEMALCVSLFSDGFLTDYQLREAINQKTPLYTNIVAYARLINFYSAQKAAQRVNATIKMDSLSEIRQQISIMVPNAN
jgi:hypothetical protein